MLKTPSNMLKNGIVESGSNENGSYIKFADGRMECEHVVDLGVGVAFTTAYGSVFHATSAHIWNYPVEFINNKVTVNATLQLPGGMGGASINHDPSKSSATIYYYSVRSYTFADKHVKLHLNAIGRWK